MTRARSPHISASFAQRPKYLAGQPVITLFGKNLLKASEKLACKWYFLYNEFIFMDIIIRNCTTINTYSRIKIRPRPKVKFNI